MAGAAPDVVFVTRKWPPAIGGIETYAVALTEALAKRRSVEVVALPGRADGRPPSGVSLIWFGITSAVGLLLRRRAPPVAHIAEMASWPLAFAAWLRSRRTRIVLSAHGTDVAFPRLGGRIGRLYGVYMRLGARLLRSATVIANSGATGAEAAGLGFRDVRVSPLATALRAEEAPGAPEPHLLFVGRLIERKGCAWFVREVLPHLPDGLHLRVVGTVWSASEGAALDHPRVDFLGKRSHDEVASLYGAALAVVLPNIETERLGFEGFGLVGTEASATGGIPLVADHGGMPEAVIDGRTGFVLPSGDAPAWIAKIVEIAGWTAETRAAFIAEAMAETHRVYSWDRVADEALEIYRSAPAPSLAPPARAGE